MMFIDWIPINYETLKMYVDVYEAIHYGLESFNAPEQEREKDFQSDAQVLREKAWN
jgi:hypothetical protein